MFFYKEKNKDIRAAAYLRLSIEDGDKAESNSIGNQRELIRDFAAERPGLHLVEEYADDGYTGTNFERPGFKRMIEDFKSYQNLTSLNRRVLVELVESITVYDKEHIHTPTLRCSTLRMVWLPLVLSPMSRKGSSSNNIAVCGT